MTDKTYKKDTPVNLEKGRYRLSKEESEAAIKRLVKFAENDQFVAANYARLLKQYPDLWVGVHQQRVVATGVTQESVLEKLHAAGIYRDGELTKFLSATAEIE